MEPDYSAVLEHPVWESTLKEVNGNFAGSEEEHTKKRTLTTVHQFDRITNGNSISR
jgi:hypothetical protein